MRIFRHYTGLPPDARGAVLAIGNFDGLHRGHQAVLQRTAEEGRRLGRPFGVLTFEPHPRQFFNPSGPPFRLTPFRVKMHLLQTYGCEIAVSLTFDRELAAKTPEYFAGNVLGTGLGAAHVVVGYDFVFGRGRVGNAALLQRLGAEVGFGVTIVEPALGDGEEPFSSTRIRDLLGEGRPREAAVLLGRAWEIDGRVETGDARGRTIGFPTANLGLGEYLRPAAGVYAVRAGIERPRGLEWHDGVANIGTRPTVGGTDLRLEAHLFDFSGDIYGWHLRVALVDWIRPERKFASFAELKDQIERDAAAARACHARLKGERTGLSPPTK